MQDKDVDQDGVGFVYSPARLPEATMAMMGCLCDHRSGKSRRKRSPSSAIAQISRGMVNVTRRLGEEMGACEDVKKQERPGHLLHSLHGAECPSLLSLNPKGWDTGASDSRWEETKTLTWM